MIEITKKRMKKFLAGLVVVFFLALAPGAQANHSWGGYHWARTANPFAVSLGNNTSGAWTSLLNIASSDWTQSTVLDTPIVPGGARPRTCRPTSGRDEVCNANYGGTGWLGLAQIWITGGTHIYQGVVKNNDYYFGSSSYRYNNSAEMQHVICQEIGHTLGLDHQSTDGSSLNTCMDYYHNTNASDTQSTHPNAGDLDQLLCIYDPADNGKTLTSSPHTCTGTGHLDSFSTLSRSKTAKPSFPLLAGEDLNSADQWGQMIRNDVRESVFERGLGGGNKLVTYVTWAK